MLREDAVALTKSLGRLQKAEELRVAGNFDAVKAVG